MDLVLSNKLNNYDTILVHHAELYKTVCIAFFQTNIEKYNFISKDYWNSYAKVFEQLVGNGEIFVF